MSTNSVNVSQRSLRSLKQPYSHPLDIKPLAEHCAISALNQCQDFLRFLAIERNAELR